MFDVIRVIPMSQDTRGRAGDNLQGRFLFGKGITGFDENTKILILFQNNGRIIGCGTLKEIKSVEIEKFRKEFLFDQILRFSKPLSLQEMQNIWGKKKIPRFGQAKYKLEDASKFPEFLDLIKDRVDSIKPLI